VRFTSPNDQLYISGISFDDSAGQTIVNFPRQHIRNGEAKNAANRTNGRYKQTIRMFKNARTCLVDRRMLTANAAPSYFVECLLYNVPDQLFAASRQQTFENVWNHVWSQLNVDAALCQNEQLLLFGTSAQQWTVQAAAQLFRGLQTLWNNWQ